MYMRTVAARTIILKKNRERERQTDINEHMRGCCLVCVRFISIETGCLKHIKLNLTRVPVIHYSASGWPLGTLDEGSRSS